MKTRIIVLSIVSLSIMIAACNSGSSNTPAPLYLNAGTYRLSYSFESPAMQLACAASLYNTSDVILISDGHGNLCHASDSDTCFNNVNYVYNPCYANYVESGSSTDGYIFDSTQWQNCNFESTGGTAKLNYVTGIRASLVILPLAACGADISIMAESN